MAVHTRKQKQIKKFLPVIELIGDAGISPVRRRHRCMECYKVDNRAHPPLTMHVLFELPLGTRYYICTQCGAMSIYDDIEDERHADFMRRMKNGNLMYKNAVREARENGNNV